MAGSATKVHQAAFRQYDHIFTIYVVKVDLWLDGILSGTIVAIEPGHIYFDIEVAYVTNDGLVLHRAEVCFCDEVAAAGSSNDDVGFLNRVYHTLNFKTVHSCLQCADRIDLGNNNTCTGTTQGKSRTLAYIAITTYYRYFTGHHHIGSAAYSVYQAFLATVFVVEFRFGNRVIHIDRRNRQCAFCHALVKTVNTCSCFFAEALDVLYQLRVVVQYDVGKITAIIQYHIQRTVFAAEEQGLLNTPVCIFQALSFPCENTYTSGSYSSGSMVLCREYIARAPANLSAQGNQGFDKHGSLYGHVQAACYARAFQWLCRSIFFTNSHKARHFRLC